MQISDWVSAFFLQGMMKISVMKKITFTQAKACLLIVPINLTLNLRSYGS